DHLAGAGQRHAVVLAPVDQKLLEQGPGSQQPGPGPAAAGGARGVGGGSYGGLSAVPWYGWRSTAEVEALGAAVASRLGCTDPATDLACLRRPPGRERRGQGPASTRHRSAG